MSKGRIGILVTAVVILVSLTYYAWASLAGNFKKVTKMEHVGFRGSAKTNPFLAAERFLKHYQYKTVTVIQYSRSLLKKADVVVVPISALPKEDYEIAVLEAWLNEGGILITGNMPDVTLNSRSLPARLKNLVGLEYQIPIELESSQDFSVDSGQIQLKGKMSVSHKVTSTRLAEVISGDKDNMMIYLYGGVTFLNDLSIFTNEDLRDEEHAALFYNILSKKDYSQNVVFINSLNSLTAWQWLWKNAKIPMAIFVICLFFYILKYTKRFGPSTPIESLDRRQILEHISASGQYFWRHKKQAVLMKKVKGELKEVIFVKHPYLKNLQNEQFYIELSEMTGEVKAQIVKAFDSEPKNEEEFLETILTLKSLRQNL
jgi:hypothetical protein